MITRAKILDPVNLRRNLARALQQSLILSIYRDEIGPILPRCQDLWTNFYKKNLHKENLGAIYPRI